MAGGNSAKDEGRIKVLEQTIQRLEKRYGKGTIVKMGEEVAPRVEVIPTGSLSLDLALGVGGYPRGRIVEIYGPEASGKTTLALHAIAEAQKLGGIGAFIDTEHALDPNYARSVGVDWDSVIMSQPDYGEQALHIVEELAMTGAVDVIVVDSVAALVPRAELEGDIGESALGLQARLMSQALRKLAATIGRTRCVCIFVNQLREKIGVMFGNAEVTPGGHALKFYASVRLDVRRIAQIKQGEHVVGHRVRVKVVKNKVAPPYRMAEFDIRFGQGIDTVGEVVDLGVQYDVIQKSGSWYSYAELRLGQGRDNVIEFLKDNPEIAERILCEVKAKALGTAGQPAPPDE